LNIVSRIKISKILHKKKEWGFESGL